MSSRRVAMTHSLLKQSLIELMEKKKLRQISIKEICENADVSRSTFYTYYGSQYDLLEAIRKEIIEASQQMAAKEANHDERHTRRLLERHFQYILDNIRMFMAFSLEGSEDYEIPRRTMQIILLPYIDEQLARRNPLISADEYEHTCLFCIFGCISVVKNWMRNPSRFTPSALSEGLIRYINAVIDVGGGNTSSGREL